MTKQNTICRVWKLMLAMVLGAFIMAFSCGASTAQAAETVSEAQAADSAAPEDNSGIVVVLMGGMLIIIIAVVLSVIGTVISTVATVEAGDEA